MYTYICLKCTQFLKINAGNSLSAHLLNKNQLNMGFSHFHGIWDNIYVPCQIDVVK